MFNILDIAFLALQKCLPKRGCNLKQEPSRSYIKKVLELEIATYTYGIEAGRAYIRTSLHSLPTAEQLAINEYVFDRTRGTLIESWIEPCYGSGPCEGTNLKSHGRGLSLHEKTVERFFTCQKIDKKF